MLQILHKVHRVHRETSDRLVAPVRLDKPAHRELRVWYYRPVQPDRLEHPDRQDQPDQPEQPDRLAQIQDRLDILGGLDPVLQGRLVLLVLLVQIQGLPVGLDQLDFPDLQPIQGLQGRPVLVELLVGLDQLAILDGPVRLGPLPLVRLVILGRLVRLAKLVSAAQLDILDIPVLQGQQDQRGLKAIPDYRARRVRLAVADLREILDRLDILGQPEHLELEIQVRLDPPELLEILVQLEIQVQPDPPELLEILELLEIQVQLDQLVLPVL